jgi:hypothetical protein
VLWSFTLAKNRCGKFGAKMMIVMMKRMKREMRLKRLKLKKAASNI